MLSTENIQSAEVFGKEGHYFLLALNENMEIIDTVSDAFSATQNRIRIVKAPKGLEVFESNKSLGKFSALSLVSANSTSVFAIKGSKRERWYRGALEFTPANHGICVVNVVELEEYVAGVVESEGGHYPAFEYFKAQAVLVRTFAIKNLNKHVSEGYNLKDDVTSQVYHGMARHKYSANILSAVLETRDTILVDGECQPILAVFHANSGGQTANSEEAWSKAIPYLRSKPDAFSPKGPSAKWEKKILKSDFYSYFASQLGTQADDIELQKAILNMPSSRRLSVFEYNKRRLPLKLVRTRFNLRSAFFGVEEEGNYLILKGKGYGHGVGMAQDGAMVMADFGYCYKEILNYYYSEIVLEKRSMVWP